MRSLFLNNGNIVQSGSPVDIYDEPINHYVADFIGESNIVDGVMIQDCLVKFAGREFECVDEGMRPNEPVEVVLRPEDLELTTVKAGKLKVKVDTQLFRGVHYEIVCHDEMGNEWIVHSTKKPRSTVRSVCTLILKISMLCDSMKQKQNLMHA